MNIFEKLNKVRQEFAQTNVRKSGRNSYSGYDYFELADFLPPIQTLCAKYGLSTIVSFTAELASMKIIDVEKPESFIEFTSPMSTANLKGCHPVQNLGAVETYQRRYLYQAAFEIVEHDALESVTGKPETREVNEADLRNTAKKLIENTDWDKEKKEKFLKFVPIAPIAKIENLIQNLYDEGWTL
jgi:hypothetical protein